MSGYSGAIRVSASQPVRYRWASDSDLASMNQSKSNEPRGGPDNPVPQAVVSRLSLYLRELQQIQQEGKETTSSTHLGSLLGFTDAQVRKDLAYFGQFGYPGIGYRCVELIEAIQQILGTDQDWPIAIIGVGNLGRALLGYRGFSRQGFRVVAAFDADKSRTGIQVEGITVYHIDALSEVARREGIRLGVIAVPGSAAQEVADRLVESGMVGVLNFAPVTLNLPDEVRIVGVDLAIELEQLSFAVVNRAPNA